MIGYYECSKECSKERYVSIDMSDLALVYGKRDLCMPALYVCLLGVHPPGRFFFCLFRNEFRIGVVERVEG